LREIGKTVEGLRQDEVLVYEDEVSEAQRSPTVA
jgi:hypothetical protein